MTHLESAFPNCPPGRILGEIYHRATSPDAEHLAPELQQELDSMESEIRALTGILSDRPEIPPIVGEQDVIAAHAISLAGYLRVNCSEENAGCATDAGPIVCISTVEPTVQETIVRFPPSYLI